MDIKLLRHGRWTFNGEQWKNRCGACCYDCELVCDYHCSEIFYTEGLCTGCAMDDKE